MCAEADLCVFYINYTIILGNISSALSQPASVIYASGLVVRNLFPTSWELSRPSSILLIRTTSHDIFEMQVYHFMLHLHISNHPTGASLWTYFIGTLTVMEPHKIDLALPVIAKMSIGLKPVLCLKEEAHFYYEMLLSSAEVLWDLCDKRTNRHSPARPRL